MLRGKFWLEAASTLLTTAGLSLIPQATASFPTGDLGKATFSGGEEILFGGMLCHLPSGSENWPWLALFTSVGVT